MSGRLAPGQVLDLDGVSAEHGVSRSVAREAIRVLESMGMVASRRRVGITIQPAVQWNMFDPRLIRWRLGAGDRAARGNNRPICYGGFALKQTIHLTCSTFSTKFAWTAMQPRTAVTVTTRRRLACLKMARQLGIWFYRTFDDRNFKSGPFQPPRTPVDPTAELAAELSRLKAERDAALTEAQRAKEMAAEAKAARLAAEQGAKGAAEERELWEQLAAEAEAAKSQLATKCSACRRKEPRPA